MLHASNVLVCWGISGAALWRHSYVDVYFAFIQVSKLNSLRSTAVIDALKQIFWLDCGSQFTNAEFDNFCGECGIQNRTVSPHHQRCQWQDGTIGAHSKEAMEQVRSQVGLLSNPRIKEKQKFYYDRKTRILKPLGNHAPVRLQPTAGSKVWTPARITGKLRPRSYAVTSEDGTFRRNRRHIIRSTEQASKQHVMSRDAVDDEADNFDAKVNNSGLPDTSPPLVEVPPSPTKREFSSSLPLTDNVSLRAHSDNASTHQYVTRSGRRVRNPDKNTL
ncbi:integrase core domain [Elysia marginata]|uniref:Integrase core domain n=1 Tax=Elysia marginata TaxID=1093978 RepID=A0AAV4JPW0_9GAST|nr:integrase core domain [Elysia marginata]